MWITSAPVLWMIRRMMLPGSEPGAGSGLVVIEEAGGGNDVDPSTSSGQVLVLRDVGRGLDEWPGVKVPGTMRTRKCLGVPRPKASRVGPTAGSPQSWFRSLGPITVALSA